ncbi:hypothetical protein C8J57DRAFT_1648469 [Mycena rebaudengoi]|nr:hypothetical protein C8J57DRAFT_1648469 [Mycena rebaudengoi]
MRGEQNRPHSRGTRQLLRFGGRAARTSPACRSSNDAILELHNKRLADEHVELLCGTKRGRPLGQWANATCVKHGSDPRLVQDLSLKAENSLLVILKCVTLANMEREKSGEPGNNRQVLRIRRRGRMRSRCRTCLSKKTARSEAVAEQRARPLSRINVLSPYRNTRAHDTRMASARGLCERDTPQAPWGAEVPPWQLSWGRRSQGRATRWGAGCICHSHFTPASVSESSDHLRFQRLPILLNCELEIPPEDESGASGSRIRRREKAVGWDQRADARAEGGETGERSAGRDGDAETQEDGIGEWGARRESDNGVRLEGRSEGVGRVGSSRDDNEAGESGWQKKGRTARVYWGELVLLGGWMDLGWMENQERGEGPGIKLEQLTIYIFYTRHGHRANEHRAVIPPGLRLAACWQHSTLAQRFAAARGYWHVQTPVAEQEKTSRPPGKKANAACT